MLWDTETIAGCGRGHCQDGDDGSMQWVRTVQRAAAPLAVVRPREQGAAGDMPQEGARARQGQAD